MSSIKIDITYKDKRWRGLNLFSKNTLKQISKLVLSYSDIAKHCAKFELSIVCADDDFITEYNKKYRDQNKATNVLSFPARQIINFDYSSLEIFDNYYQLGDIIFSLDTLEKEALEQKKSLTNHFTHLFIHSLLHLIGYDHIKENDRIAMEAKEIELLEKLSISNPYEA